MILFQNIKNIYIYIQVSLTGGVFPFDKILSIIVDMSKRVKSTVSYNPVLKTSHGSMLLNLGKLGALMFGNFHIFMISIFLDFLF